VIERGRVVELVVERVRTEKEPIQKKERRQNEERKKLLSRGVECECEEV
jgi:hypothetical protein